MPPADCCSWNQPDPVEVDPRNRDRRSQAVDGEDEEREQDLPTEIRHRKHVAVDGENVHGLSGFGNRWKGNRHPRIAPRLTLTRG